MVRLGAPSRVCVAEAFPETEQEEKLTGLAALAQHTPRTTDAIHLASFIFFLKIFLNYYFEVPGIKPTACAR